MSEIVDVIQSYSGVKIVIGLIVIWIVSGMVFCSCCQYSIIDMIKLFIHFLYSLISGNNEMSLEVKNIKTKPCNCDSPWYSPCVIWGSKKLKDSCCNKDKKNNTMENDDCDVRHNVEGKYSGDCKKVSGSPQKMPESKVILINRMGNRSS
jgi:hypothetical protein